MRLVWLCGRRGPGAEAGLRRASGQGQRPLPKTRGLQGAAATHQLDRQRVQAFLEQQMTVIPKGVLLDLVSVAFALCGVRARGVR